MLNKFCLFLNEQYHAGWKKTKLNDKYTCALYFIPRFQGTSCKNYKIQLPVFFISCCFTSASSGDIFFKVFFRKALHPCIKTNNRHVINLGQRACKFIFWSKKILKEILKEHCTRTQQLSKISSVFTNF